MKYIVWGLRLVFALLVFAVLDYTLPAKHTVRVVEAQTRLTPISWNGFFWSGEDTGTTRNASDNRDVRFIDTMRTNGKPLVFRNEDTGFIWPPYFKYDSSNLQAIASDMKSASADPRWVSVTSYGWRVAWASIYPNAVKMVPVAGPDVRPTNWGRQIVLLLIGALLFLIWRMWAQFRERTIDPALQNIDDAWDRVDARADAARDRASGWLSRFLGRR